MAAVTLSLLSSIIAAAHVAPSVDDNNRYVTITPFGDRVRVAYVVFFGEVPGAIERRMIDSNRDGQISNAEGHAYAVAFGAQLEASLEAEVDGVVAPLRWSSIEVGMGSPEVAAGTFSIDLVAYACLAGRAPHHFTFHDRFRVPHPGETEVKVDDAPGITIERARIGAADDPSHDYRFAGPGGPIADQGLDLAFTAGPNAAVTADATCAAATRATSHPIVWVLIGLGVVVIGGMATLVRRRRPTR